MENTVVRDLTREEVRLIYDRHMVGDFPDNERKPLSMIEGALDAGHYRCLGFFAAGQTGESHGEIVTGEDEISPDALSGPQGDLQAGLLADLLAYAFFVILPGEEGPSLLFDYLAVVPALRDQGIGSAFIAALPTGTV